MSPKPMWVETQAYGDVTVIRVKRPTLQDDEETDGVFEALADLVADPGRQKFVLNVAAVQYFASAALGKLVAFNRRVRETGSQLVLCRLTPTVERVLQLTRLSDVLLTYDDEFKAREAVT